MLAAGRGLPVDDREQTRVRVLVERGRQPRSARAAPTPRSPRPRPPPSAAPPRRCACRRNPAGAHDHRVAAFDEVRDPRLHSRRPWPTGAAGPFPTPPGTRGAASRPGRAGCRGARGRGARASAFASPRRRGFDVRRPGPAQQPLGWGRAPRPWAEGSHTRPCLQTKKNPEPIGLAYIFLRAVAVTVTAARRSSSFGGSVTAAAEELVVTQPSVSPRSPRSNARSG